jgi:beta-exotoxin I transport system permease protein
MESEVARVDLRSRRKSLVGYAVGLGLYTLVIVALYPAFKDSTSLDKILKESPSIAALFGISGSITSPDGWTNANLYANFLPLIVLLLTIGYGASAVAGEEEAGRLDLIVSLPLSRRRIIAEKSAVMLLQAGSVCVVTYGCMLVGRAFDLRLDAWNLATTTLGVLLLGVSFGCVALAIGAARGERGPALGITTALASAAYLISSLGPVVSWLDNWRVLSPFYWAIGNNQLNRGLGWDGLLVLGGITTAAITAAVISFERHDLRG